MKAVIFDIDGTLSLIGDRVKYLQQSPKDWDSFYAACGEDKPNKPIIKVARNIYGSREFRDHTFILLTGRRDSCRASTVPWLEKYGVWWDELLMRPDGDFRHDTEVKPELIKDHGITEAIIFEDRDSMVKKWRELGYTCLQVALGDF